MGLSVYGLRILLVPRFTQLWGNLFLLTIAITAGMAIFLITAWALKMKELHMLLPVLRKRSNF
jgi:hypothetical protein